MVDKAWLKKLCAPEGHLRAPWATRPFLVRRPGTLGDWVTVATNAKVLVALDGDHADGVAPEGRIPDLAPFLHPLAAEDRVEEIDLDTLRRWVGPPRWTEPCEHCKGAGVTGRLNRQCGECDGDKTVSAPARPVLFLGQYLDRELLGQALEGLPAGTARVTWLLQPKEPREKGDPLPVLCLDGPGWRVVLMPMIPDGDAIKDRAIPTLGQDEVAPYLAWHGGAIGHLLAGCHDDRSWDALAVAADMLEEAGAPAEWAAHCRRPHQSDRPCWLADAWAASESPNKEVKDVVVATDTAERV